MADDTKAGLLDWAKVGAVIVGQFVAVIAFAFILKADVDYLKRDVGELRIDMKQMAMASVEYKAEAKSISIMAAQIAENSRRINKLESLFLPGKGK